MNEQKSRNKGDGGKRRKKRGSWEMGGKGGQQADERGQKSREDAVAGRQLGCSMLAHRKPARGNLPDQHDDDKNHSICRFEVGVDLSWASVLRVGGARLCGRLRTRWRGGATTP